MDLEGRYREGVVVVVLQAIARADALQEGPLRNHQNYS